MPWAALADLVLLAHFGVVVFVVGGLLVVPIGNTLRWSWVNGWWFRSAHASTMGVIVVQAWLGQHCPLTILESWLRAQAGSVATYEASFVQTWVERLLYFNLPIEVFALLYTGFGLAILGLWRRYPPHALRGADQGNISRTQGK